MSGEYRLSKRQVVLERHILWVRRTKKIIPSVTKFRRGRPQRIKLTNVSDRAVYFPAHDDISVLVPAGDLPRGDGYVRVDSKKYRDWQVLAYEGCRDRELFQRECELYEQWLVTQPPSVERPDYPESQEIATRPPQDSLEGPGDRLTCAERWEKIMEEGERPETCHASGVTIGDSVDVQRPESSSDGETAASRGVNITIEDSCRHAHGRRSNMKVVQPATNVRLESSADIGPPDLVTITLEGICPSDEPPTSCSMIILSEDSATSPEVQDTTDEAIVPVPRVHSEVSGDTGVSAPVTATPGGICPGQGVPTSRAANIAIADLSVSTQRLKAMSTEMNPALSIRLECGVDSGTTETATVTLDETCVSVAHVSSVTNSVDLQESLPLLAAQSKYVPTVRTNPCLLCSKLPRDYRGFVMLFD
ncbi:hypothetical protein PC118_g18355 [Phytophthora cactorum]|uniref:Uncharacterized protein n=2 Tax=Phytophthora cactorum TaxID=29920 RepID=A0A8T1F8Q3_9STRA|nr:hypothetical protein PC118_g18355 [Phytophthora cactorum]